MNGNKVKHHSNESLQLCWPNAFLSALLFSGIGEALQQMAIVPLRLRKWKTKTEQGGLRSLIKNITTLDLAGRPRGRRRCRGGKRKNGRTFRWQEHGPLTATSAGQWLMHNGPGQASSMFFPQFRSKANGSKCNQHSLVLCFLCHLVRFVMPHFNRGLHREKLEEIIVFNHWKC